MGSRRDPDGLDCLSSGGDRSMTPAPKRRWLRWTLGTLFFLLAGVACWLGDELNWIRKRHQALTVWAAIEARDKDPVAAPGILWVFGEQGHAFLVRVRAGEKRPTPEEQAEKRRIQRLFPEATVSWIRQVVVDPEARPAPR